MAKHKFASISLTVRDRAISSKFSIHRISKECTLSSFPKIFTSPKVAAILNFRIFAKNGKKQFYCVNTSYPMDNCLARRDRSRQTPEKDVRQDRSVECIRQVAHHTSSSCLDVIASFSFGAWRVKTCFLDKRIFCSTPNTTF